MDLAARMGAKFVPIPAPDSPSTLYIQDVNCYHAATCSRAAAEIERLTAALADAHTKLAALPVPGSTALGGGIVHRGTGKIGSGGKVRSQFEKNAERGDRHTGE